MDCDFKHSWISAGKKVLRCLPRILVSHRARSSFMGSRLASCRLASHWWYCCISVRPGTLECLGLRELHMVPYRPPGEDKHRNSAHHDAMSALNLRLQKTPDWINKHFHNSGDQLLIIMAIFCINSRQSSLVFPLGAEDNQIWGLLSSLSNPGFIFSPPDNMRHSYRPWQPTSCLTPVGPAWLIEWDIYSTV